MLTTRVGAAWSSESEQTRLYQNDAAIGVRNTRTAYEAVF
jgi:hypothetical protein